MEPQRKKKLQQVESLLRGEVDGCLPVKTFYIDENGHDLETGRPPVPSGNKLKDFCFQYIDYPGKKTNI